MVSVDSTQFREAENISEVLKNWRAVLRRDKEMATVHNMERQSDGPRISLKAATDILSNTAVWEFFEETVTNLQLGGLVDTQKLDAITYILAHAVMVNSSQRPGSVQNLTLEEFKEARQEKSTGGDVWVLRVHRHKTQTQGSAHLILTVDLMDKMRKYLDHVRPQQVNVNPSDAFFLRNGGKKLEHMAQRVEVQARKFNFTFVSATELRKAVSTEATKNLEPAEKGLIL